MSSDPPVLTLLLNRQYTGEGAYHDPAFLLKGITPEQAVTVPAGCVHSIALSLEHINFWLRLYLGWVREGKASDPAAAGTDFITPPASDWPKVLAEYEALVAEARDLAAEPGLAERRIEMMGDQIPVAKLLGDLAVHNAYHFGQIVLLRRLLGIWPPA